MNSEESRTIEAIQMAIQMEIDGKEFYLEASRASGNEAGEKLLERLAADEDIHRQKFERIFRALEQKKGWPEITVEPGHTQELKTVFSQQMEKMNTSNTAADTELKAIETAMSMENKTYDFYKSRSDAATYPAEKEFYEAVAAEETVHHQLLRDYYDFLKDPVNWFTQKEHPSLDGG